MATSQENVFRFVAVRPPDTTAKGTKEKMELYSVDTEEPTPLYLALEEAQKKGAGRPAMAKIAAEFRESESYVDRLSELVFDVEPVVDWVVTNRDRPCVALAEEIKERYQNLDQVVSSVDFRQSHTALADTILCDVVKPHRPHHSNDRIIGAFKLMGLLKRLADDPSLFEADRTVGEMVSAYRIVLPEIARAPAAPLASEDQNQKEGDQKKQDPKKEEVVRLREHLRKLEVARKEFSRIATDPGYRRRTDTDETERDPRIQSLEHRVSELTLALKRLEQQHQPEAEEAKRVLAESIQPVFAAEARSPFLSAAAVEDLKQESKEIIAHLEIDRMCVSPEHVLRLIEEEMRDTSARLPSDFTPRKVLVLHGMTVDMEEFRKAISGGTAEAGVAAHPSGAGERREGLVVPLPDWASCKFQAGVADLLVVKQELKAYEVADFAHVENVLAGESRDREHRRLNVREEYVELETEEAFEKERDLQSTERNEMQAEAEKVVQSQFELSAGTEISGSYGGVVSFSANLDVGYGTSTQESKSKAQSYAREVTQQTSERIMERVREERRTRVLEEIEETSKHEIENETGRHVRGIYRWLNKIYEAQILNYGQRMMFEFTIPEPAASFLYAMVENPPPAFVLDKPAPPTLDGELDGEPLRPDHILSRGGSGGRYSSELIAQYRVTNAPVPPPQFVTVTHFEAADGDGDDEKWFARAGTIEIPEGYEAYEAFADCKARAHHRADDADFWGNIGHAGFGREGDRYYQPELERRFTGSISFNLGVFRSPYFALSIHVFCQLTQTAQKQWQQDMYDAVMDAYNQQRLDYEDKKAALGLQAGIPILGRNPLENRQIERDELRKLVIMMLMHSPDFEFDSFSLPSSEDEGEGAEGEEEEPVISILKACDNGAAIRFFEQAFEWNNMLYVFYPYFWGRRDRWSTALHITDPDADFAAFLKAGAARVQVPVRPGFEPAVAYYCQTGEVWEGNDPPLIDDDLYVPIVDEIIENMGRFDEGLPYPDPENPQTWEVTVPTSLVVVQNLEEIPAIRDILTGEPITILEDA